MHAIVILSFNARSMCNQYELAQIIGHSMEEILNLFMCVKNTWEMQKHYPHASLSTFLIFFKFLNVYITQRCTWSQLLFP